MVAQLFRDRTNLACMIFFAVLVVLGVAVHRDYGLSWDEPFQAAYGHQVFAYVFQGDAGLFQGTNKYYGPAFELVLVGVEKMAGITDLQTVYFMRHLLTFLLFAAGVYFFYRLNVRIFASRILGLLGALFLVLSPRIFAHAFYNPKDVPFLAVFVISIYTLVRYLDDKSIRNAVIHALACALVVDIRVVGLVVPLITLGFAGFDALKRHDSDRRLRELAGLGVYLACLIPLVILFWPTLWHRPFHNIVEAFGQMSHYPYQGSVFYLGRYVPAAELPWHYTPVWILISTPVTYAVFFLVGIGFAAKTLVRSAKCAPKRRNLILLLTWFLLPLGYVMFSDAVVYDAWRHTFFIYPALLAIALLGLRGLFRLVRARLTNGTASALRLAMIMFLSINLAGTAWFMIRNHPYQNLYFNMLVGGVRGAAPKFDLDYWGVSYRKALEFLVSHDSNRMIKVSAHSRPGETNAALLPADQRCRLVFLDDPLKAKYFVTDRRWERRQYRPQDILYLSLIHI